MCIFSLQICQGIDDEIKTELYKRYYRVDDLESYLNGSNAIKDLGAEFVEDVRLIHEKLDNNIFVVENVLILVSDLALSSQWICFE